MNATTTDASELTQQLGKIPTLPRSELLQMWQEHYDQKASTYVSRRLLELSAAWDLQCKAAGGMDRELHRLLDFDSGGSGRKSAGRRSIKPGTRLVREWNGRTHHVEVLPKGFRWNDGEYRSLSVIASEITGAHWSGPRFFGL